MVSPGAADDSLGQERNLVSEYEKLATTRQPFLTRARACAKVTLPYIAPPDGHDGSQALPTPKQSIGSQGVNNLANQLLESLLPPRAPYLRLEVDDQTLASLVKDKKKRAAVEERLASFERQIKARTDRDVPRAAVLTIAKHLIVAGNALAVFYETGTTRVFRLDSYAVKRSGGGKWTKIITREEVDPKTLPEDVQEKLAKLSTPGAASDGGTAAGKDGNVTVYTLWEREGKTIRSWQQVRGIHITGSDGSWPEDLCPAMPLRWSWLDGEDYGRGLCEEYIGDLIAAEQLTSAIRNAAAAASHVLILVNPSGTTDEQDVAEAEALDVISGREEDVRCLQLNKAADMQVANAVLGEITQRLAAVFVMHLGVRRNADRVTAEETRMVIMALEGALGGTYSLLAQEFQLPLARLIMGRLEKEGKLPPMPKGKRGEPEIIPQITTGIEALGRGEDFNRYTQFITSVRQLLGDDAVREYINLPDLITRLGASLSLDANGLVKDELQRQQEAAAAQAAQEDAMASQGAMDIATKVIPEAMKGTPPTGPQ